MSIIFFRLCSGWSNLCTKLGFKGKNTIGRYRFFSVKIFWSYKIVVMLIKSHRFYHKEQESIVKSCKLNKTIQSEFILLCCNSMMLHHLRCIISFTILLPINYKKINKRKKSIKLRKMEKTKIIKMLMILWLIFRLKIKTKLKKIWTILMKWGNFHWKSLKESLNRTSKNSKMP